MCRLNSCVWPSFPGHCKKIGDGENRGQTTVLKIGDMKIGDRPRFYENRGQTTVLGKNRGQTTVSKIGDRPQKIGDRPRFSRENRGQTTVFERRK